MDGARILIIDDEENIRETMQFALDAVGYRTEIAPDGPHGLALFGDGQGWDLVLLDQRMPGMEGLEVLRTLRERNPHARIVMVTAYGTIELAVDAMKAGAVDFLRKPFTPDVLRGAVRTALSLPATEPGLDYSLERLLPAERPAAEPHIRFRTLNGYQFWPAPLPAGGEETSTLRIRRAFEVRSPRGETRTCAVDLSTGVRALIRAEVKQEYPAEDPFWDTIAKGALSQYLWQQAEMPPEVLPVYELTREQLEVARAMAGLGPSVRR